MTTKNEKIKASLQATRLKRASQIAVTRELKLTRFSAEQGEALIRVFLEAKWLYNHLVATSSWNTWDTKQRTVPVRLPSGQFEERELRYLGSQVKQKVAKQIEYSLRTLATQKKRGVKAGALRPQRSYNGLQYIQHGTSYRLKGKKLKLQGLPGWFSVRGTEQLEGLELASAKLVQRPSGYYLKVTGFRAPQEPGVEAEVGLDFGIKTHLTASDGREWSVTVREPERLKRLQRKLQRQVKGSKNRERTKLLIGREYEKLTHRKDELANQIVSELKSHSRIVLQDENLTSWKVRYGKTIQHSVLGRVKAKLLSLPNSVVVDRFAPTTQLCPSCGSLNKLALSEREYSCECGYSAPRDLHAARNMLLFAELSPAERGVAPADWKATVSGYAARKSRQDETGNETAKEMSRESGASGAAETRSSSVVA